MEKEGWGWDGGGVGCCCLSQMRTAGSNSSVGWLLNTREMMEGRGGVWLSMKDNEALFC